MKKILVKEKCIEESLKYKTRGELRKNSPSIYNTIIRNKWQDVAFSHMIQVVNSKNYWTKEQCHIEALKFKHRSEFSKKSKSAYSKAWDMKWLDDICGHMENVGNLNKRCIYACEFDDNFVYIGLTYNMEIRKQQHIKRGTVKKHIDKTGNYPVFKILTEYLNEKLAIIEEREFLKIYTKNNWKILNVAETGALGGGRVKWTKEKCQEESLKYNNVKEYKKNSNSYRAAVRNKWLDDICSHMSRTKKNFNYWIKDRCAQKALLCKSKFEFQKLFPGGYSASKKNMWLEDICTHMEIKKIKPKGYWTKENCHKEAIKYNSRSKFQRGSRSAYQISLRNNWIDEICRHMMK